MAKLCEMCRNNGWLIPDEGILTCEGCVNKSMYSAIWTCETKGEREIESRAVKRKGVSRTLQRSSKRTG